MTELQASRTLVKSPPELWAECSDAAALARHLGRFGEIRITRLDPETAVAWEGEHARGTVRIEPAGWGTRVILTATAVAQPVEQPPGAGSAMPDAVAAEGSVEDPVGAGAAGEAPVVPPAPVAPPPRRRPFARLLAFLRGPAREPEIVPTHPPQPEPVAVDPLEPEVVESGPEPRGVEILRDPEAVETLPAPDTVEPLPEPKATEPERAAEPPPPAAPPDTKAALAAALDSLGQAHHRPFSRA